MQLSDTDHFGRGPKFGRCLGPISRCCSLKSPSPWRPLQCVGSWLGSFFRGTMGIPWGYHEDTMGIPKNQTLDHGIHWSGGLGAGNAPAAVGL